VCCLLFLLLACRDGGTPDTAADPARWDLPALDLSPGREVAVRSVEGLATLRSLHVLRERATTFALDRDGTLSVLDAHYDHSPDRWCIDPSSWAGTGDAAWQGSCADGEVEVRRGRLDPGPPVRAVSVDEAGLRVFVLDAEGGLSVASADVLAGDPFAWLRLEPYAALGVDGITEAAMVWDGQALHVATGERVTRLEGDAVTTSNLQGTVVSGVLAAGEPWWVTSAGVEHGGALEGVDAVDLVGTEQGAWIGTLEGVVSPDGTSIGVDGSLGWLAHDERSGAVWVATEGGLVRLLDGEQTAVPLDHPVAGLAGGPGHELVVWTGDEVRVLVDEEALLAAGEPLEIWATTFVEKPQTPDQPGECLGDEGLQARVALANENSAWLDDTPATWALGVTPNHLRTARACGLVDELEPILNHPRREVGALIHEEPEGCDDVACTVDFLAEMGAELAWYGSVPTWTSALAPLSDLGLDWRAAIVESGAPLRYLFFGLSILDEVPHHDDPRAKDAYPLDTSELAAAWSEGGVSFYPMNNLPAFNLGGCANQLLLECHQTGQGFGHSLSAEDVAVLDLLLVRSLAVRGDGPATWSFHLPDLGAYDYTTDCTVADGVWSGEACQVTLLQDWLTDVHQRYVQNGLARWALPSELPRP